jgi:hypothetical protein
MKITKTQNLIQKHTLLEMDWDKKMCKLNNGHISLIVGLRQ